MSGSSIVWIVLIIVIIIFVIWLYRTITLKNVVNKIKDIPKKISKSIKSKKWLLNEYLNEYFFKDIYLKEFI